jgi:hypothetical protein
MGKILLDPAAGTFPGLFQAALEDLAAIRRGSCP